MERVKSYFNYTYSFPEHCIDASGVDWGNRVFYVGKGTGSGRLDAHLTEASGDCECLKCQVIRWIWGKEKSPVRQIVFDTSSERKALDNEKGLIQGQYNAEPLTNTQHVLDAAKPYPVNLNVVMEEVESAVEGIVEKDSDPVLLLDPLLDQNLGLVVDLPFPVDWYESRKFYATDDLNGRGGSYEPYNLMSPKIDKGGETFLNMMSSCKFVGVGWKGTQFLFLADEYGLNKFMGNHVTYYRKKELLKFIDWMAEAHPEIKSSPDKRDPGWYAYDDVCDG